jgi:hypothetical protein
MFVKKFFLALFLFVSVIGASEANLQPFVYYSTYENSFKDTDKGIGVFGSFSDNVSQWKFSATFRSVNMQTNLSFLDSNNSDENTTTPPDDNPDDNPNDNPDDNATTPPDANVTAVYAGVDTNDTNETELGYADNYYQGDIVIGYTRRITKYVSVDAAFHYTLSDLFQADKNKIFYLGASYSKPYRFKVGIDGAYSIYNDNSLASEVMQISPYFASWFGEPRSMMGRIYYKIKYYYIKPLKENIELSSNYNYFEFSLYQQTENFVNRIAFSTGDAINIVKDGGFTVYTDNEIQEKSFLLSSTYNFSPTFGLRGAYVYTSFTEYNPILTKSTDSATMNRFVLSALLKF